MIKIMEAATQALLRKKEELEAERNNIVSDYDKRISELEMAIETLSGKKVWELQTETRYDDENPNYFKGSHEEM